MTVTEIYQKNHLSGFDCRMTTFRNNLAYYGCSLSNGMILGMSGCLTFVYSNLKNNRIPFYTVTGITDQTLEGLSSVFDTYITRGQYSYGDKDIIESLKQKLEKHSLINVAINRPFLEHIRSGKEKSNYIVEFSNIGFHYVTITAIKGRMVTFFETDYGHPLEYDFDTFMELWFFDDIHKRLIIDPPQRCNGQFYTILPPNVIANKDKKTILHSINKVVVSFFSDKGSIYHGSKGIDTFFNEIYHWNTDSKEESIFSSIQFMRILEKYLSGGGFGRRLYSYFLSEVSTEWKDYDLKAIAMEFRDTSKLWSEFIAKISDVNTLGNLLEYDFNQFLKIVDEYSDRIICSEKKQFENLRNWIDSK